MDRNPLYIRRFAPCNMSLSARRAWIEINQRSEIGSSSNVVALRKESVDRNNKTCLLLLSTMLSLSARRAWIEITSAVRWALVRRVALRKESVDRNISYYQCVAAGIGRSPQGERG